MIFMFSGKKTPPEKTGFWHYGGSLVGSMEFSENMFWQSLAFMTNST